MRVKKLNQKGFSLIELMIVVGIIGVLATMAVPKFSAFQAKAKMTEAKTTLNHIYTLQEAYFIDFSLYSGKNDTGIYGAHPTAAATQHTSCNTPPQWSANIGFTLTPCNAQKPLYSYSLSNTAGTAYSAQGITGTGVANKLFPSCSTADTWTMNQDHVLSHAQDAIPAC